MMAERQKRPFLQQPNNVIYPLHIVIERNQKAGSISRTLITFRQQTLKMIHPFLSMNHIENAAFLPTAQHLQHFQIDKTHRQSPATQRYDREH